MNKMNSSKTSAKHHCGEDRDYGESSKTDSGFLSGANLISEECLLVDNLPKSESNSIKSLEYEDKKINERFVQIDSGVDVGLNEQFSGLTLERQSSKESVQCSQNLSTDSINSFKSGGDKFNGIKLTQPWELYFQQDEEGDTQLHIAIIQGFIEVVYSLVKMAPHPSFLDILNDVVQSPLHLAVLTHQSVIVRHLILSGASVDIRDRHGNTPLHLACQLGDIGCVKSLTEPISLSEINSFNLHTSNYAVKIPPDFMETNYEGETCLHLAAYGGHIEIIKHLIWYGASVTAQEKKGGQTILHYAVETSNRQLLRFLLDECPPSGSKRLLLNAKNYSGRTAYQLARVLDVKVAADLLSKGAQKVDADDADDISDEDCLEDEEHPDHNMADEEATEEYFRCENKNLRTLIGV